MKQVLRIFYLLAAAGLALGAGAAVSARVHPWLLAEALLLAAVAVAAWLLPGAPALWVELLGTMVTLPVIWRTWPASQLLILPGGLLNLPVYVMYGILSLLVATLAPMMLFLILDRLLE